MNAENCLLPVPVNNNGTNTETVLNLRKVKRGGKIYLFLLFFAIYLLSTLLGAALVPGRLKLDGTLFLLSVTGNGALFLCAERCFFALFYLILSFTFLRFPAAVSFMCVTGLYMGICIRLIIYTVSPLFSVLVSALFAVQIILDCLCVFAPYRIESVFDSERRAKYILTCIFCCVFYIVVTYFLSFSVVSALKFIV